jgi:histidine triad (HIT) family protein
MTQQQRREWERPDWYCNEILSGKEPVERIYENEHALAFQLFDDLERKKLSVHVMVIPKRHVETLLDITPQDGAVMMGLVDAVQGTAKALDLEQSGLYLRINCLPPYQHTPHMHWHVMVKANRGRNAQEGTNESPQAHPQPDDAE